MICPKCGRNIEKDRFCIYCGSQLTKTQLWIRFFARITDYLITGSIISIIFDIIDLNIQSISYFIVVGALAIFVWVFAEAILLSTFGTTFGKWLFRMTITDSTGKKLTFSKALDRSATIWLKGFAGGITPIYLVTLANLYQRLSIEGTTDWDSKGGYIISHKEIDPSRVIYIISFFIIFIFLVVFVDNIPRDEIIEVGNSDYILSKDAQKYIKVSYRADYDKSKSIIIIEEPHQNLKGQYNLYKGLETFFNDNPSLINKTIFLSEGFPSGKYVSLQPLIDAEPNPDDVLVEDVLSSYLITGYIAYEWRYQKGIPIVGIEDQKLYDLSARLWLESQDRPDDSDISKSWEGTVTARNKNIANVFIEKTTAYENPILFVGGKHLSKYNNDLSIEIDVLSGTGGSSHLENYENLGLHDYLKKEKIGYTFIVANTNSFESAYERERNINVYNALFKAQQTGDYDGYIEWLTFGNLNYGVTVAPSAPAAASFVGALKASTDSGSGSGSDKKDDDKKDDDKKDDDKKDDDKKDDDKKDDNKKGDDKKGDDKKGGGSLTPSRGDPNTKKEFPNPKGGKTIREYGDDGKAKKDIDYGHPDHGHGDPHAHDWDWSKRPPRQDGRSLESGEQ